MSVTIQRQEYSDALGQEILPLAQKCWDEGTLLKGESCAYHEFRNVKIEPDFSVYRALSAKGSLIVFTVRDNEVLVGYATAFLYNSPHHCKILTANGDSIYVEPEYRAHASLLMERMINEVKSKGAATMNWMVSPDGPMFEVLSSFGFVGDEIVMEKFIARSQI